MDEICERLKALELDLLKPHTRTDHTRLAALISPVFMEVGASGQAFGKEHVLARLPDEQDIRFDVAGLTARLLSPTVGLVTYRCTKTHADAITHSMRSSVWVNGTDGWQMVYHQGTLCGDCG